MNAAPSMSQKPLIFISWASGDEDNRDRLKQALAKYSGQIEVWDDGMVPVGEHREETIRAAIDRAALAVTLLSPRYFTSPFCQAELRQIEQRRARNAVILFPVVTLECPWREVEPFKTIHVWNRGAPVKRLVIKGARTDFDDIADAVMKRLKEDPTKMAEEESREPQYSDRALELFKRARSVSGENGRPGVISSSLLFAFVDMGASTQKDTATFVRRVMEKSGRLEKARSMFAAERLSFATVAPPYGEDYIGPVSEGTHTLLKLAWTIAIRVSGVARIRLCHLFAALISPDIRPNAQVRMESIMGVNLSKLRQEFTDAICQDTRNGDLKAWREILLGRNEAVPVGDSSALSGSYEPLPPMSLDALLAGPDFGDFLSGNDKEAFRTAARMADAHSAPEVLPAHVLLAYLLTAKPSVGGSEAALAVLFEKSIVRTTNTGNAGQHLTRQLLGEASWLAFQESKDLLAPQILISRRVLSLMTWAAAIGQEAGSAERFSTRHLLACLICPGPYPSAKVLNEDVLRLTIDLGSIRQGFYAWFLAKHREDKSEVIARVLGIVTSPAPAPTPAPVVTVTSERPQGPAAYSAEFCGLGMSGRAVDKLQVARDARRFAELIAARDTRMPLAIGLFGNWGSGKTHFMNLLDADLKALAEEEQKAKRKVEDQKWCPQIVPVYFNAWHYVDANLWASLVSQIFENLFAHLNPEKKEGERVEAELVKAAGATALAKEELKLMEAALAPLEAELDKAEEKRNAEQGAVDGMLAGLKSLLTKSELTELKEQVGSLKGVEQSLDTLEDLQKVVREAESQFKESQALWTTVCKPEGRAWRLTWLAAVVFLGPAILLLVPCLFTEAKVWLAGAEAWMLPSLASVAGVVHFIAKQVESSRGGLTSLQTWLKSAEAAYHEGGKSPEIKAAQAKLAQATQQVVAAQERVKSATLKVDQLKLELQDLTPARRLGRFITTRAKSADYDTHLGLASMARKDFEALSKLFADAEELKRRMAGLPEDEATELRNLSNSIDRIVLYVDDLDRCESAKVVEVLQAVHLLLAFPLFTVIVGVDQRCLKRSLYLERKGLVAPDGETRNEDGSIPLTIENPAGAGRSATALDYLEKIFHVPFHLRGMSPDTFGDLVHHLTEPPPLPARKDRPREPGPTPTPTPPVVPHDMGGPSVTPEPPTKENPDVVVPHRMLTQPEPPPKPPAANLSTPEPEPEGRKPLHDWERDALKQYHPLIATPRALTRLINTYRLVRAGILDQAEWQAFCGTSVGAGESRLVMLLLAGAAGHPAVARTWFQELRTKGLSAALNPTQKVGTDQPAWAAFATVANNTLGTPATNTRPGPEVVARWLDRVERFAF